MQAEYQALSDFSKEAVFVRWLVQELDFMSQQPVVLFCDNTAAIQLANKDAKIKLPGQDETRQSCLPCHTRLYQRQVRQRRESWQLRQFGRHTNQTTRRSGLPTIQRLNWFPTT
jgi:hypothetical protein